MAIKLVCSAGLATTVLPAATAAATAAVLELGIRMSKAIGSKAFRVILGNQQDRSTEGGIEALEAYLNTKFVSQLSM